MNGADHFLASSLLYSEADYSGRLYWLQWYHKHCESRLVYYVFTRLGLGMFLMKNSTSALKTKALTLTLDLTAEGRCM